MTPGEPASPICQSCGADGMRRHCPECGQAAWPGRLTMRRALRHAFDAAADLDGRIPRTIIGLTVRPGRVILEHVAGRTVRHVPPFRYLLAAAALVTVLSVAAGAAGLDAVATMRGVEITPDAAAEPVFRKIDEALRRWFQVILIGVVPLQALAGRAVFAARDLNVAEHHVLSAYVVGHQTLLYLPFLPWMARGGPASLQATLAYTAISFGYMGWAYVSVFGKPRLLVLVQAAFVALLAYGAYTALGVVLLIAWLGASR